jgi:hypothetical protein
MIQSDKLLKSFYSPQAGQAFHFCHNTKTKQKSLGCQ